MQSPPVAQKLTALAASDSFANSKFSGSREDDEHIRVRMNSPGRFNASALYEALDDQRRSRGLSWTQVAAEVGVSASTLTRTKLGGRMEVDGRLAMVRWLNRSTESFTFGYTEPQSYTKPKI